jgi:hypothetical protein
MAEVKEWNITHRSGFVLVASTDKRQLKIIKTAWDGEYHVIEELLELGSPNSIYHIADAARIKELYGIEVGNKAE